MVLRFWRSLLRPGAWEPSSTHEELRYVRTRELLLEGNRIALLCRGREAFPAMLAAIRAARSHVHLETYILRSDATGERFKEALIERARAGVKVRLLFDSVGSLRLVSNGYLAVLAHAGVEIVEFHPVTPWRHALVERLVRLRASADRRLGRARPRQLAREPGHWHFNRRDHQKILVVDDRIAFTGGLNLGDEYAPGPEGGDWHDLHARVEGPAALGLAHAFYRAWLDADAEPFAPPGEPPAPSAELRPMLAHTCDNFGMRNRSRMHQAYRHAIRNARESVTIENAYFIPDQLLRMALYDAARRGASVRIIVPANSDVKLVGWASRYLFARLMRRGVRIFEYPERMMHAKAAVIDGVWSTIGSFNLDRRSMRHNLEAGLVILDAGFAAQLERQFERDLALCREITATEWSKRGAWARFMEWFAHLFSYWL